MYYNIYETNYLAFSYYEDGKLSNFRSCPSVIDSEIDIVMPTVDFHFGMRIMYLRFISSFTKEHICDHGGISLISIYELQLVNWRNYDNKNIY